MSEDGTRADAPDAARRNDEPGQRAERFEARDSGGEGRGEGRSESRGEGRGDGRRGARGERDSRRSAGPAPVSIGADEASVVQAFMETQPPGTESADNADSQGERQAGRRRNRRGGRGGRDRDESRAGEADNQAATEAPPVETMAALDGGDLALLDAGRDDEAPAVDANQSGENGEGRRRGRGRDRNRRERTADEVATTDGIATGEGAQRRDEETAAPMQPDERHAEHPGSAPSLPTQRTEAPIELASPPFPVPDQVPGATAPQPVEAAPEHTPRTAEPFVLPLGSLEAIAESAGLQWVNSDAEKIRAVQEAMANQPSPIHAPRERKAVAATDEGPLVLVETRKDLSQFKLPFETVQQETQGRV